MILSQRFVLRLFGGRLRLIVYHNIIERVSDAIVFGTFVEDFLLERFDFGLVLPFLLRVLGL